ncbi:hypothetical protein [Clostridium botulinum]|uniref:hypothetical protein n=1 Tax=Clostridium botulinum TaxID=1491 RepID=UPI000A8EDADB|nr:hypothetical protein [Clostridium botulinum]
MYKYVDKNGDYMTKLRKVNEKDCEPLFQWANDKEVRKNSFNTEDIIYEEHRT